LIVISVENIFLKLQNEILSFTESTTHFLRTGIDSARVETLPSTRLHNRGRCFLEHV